MLIPFESWSLSDVWDYYLLSLALYCFRSLTAFVVCLWCFETRKYFVLEQSMQKVTRGACTGLVNNLSQGSVLLIADSIGFRDYFMFGIKKKKQQFGRTCLPLPFVQYISCWNAVETLLIWLCQKRLLLGEMPFSVDLTCSDAAKSTFPSIYRVRAQYDVLWFI